MNTKEIRNHNINICAESQFFNLRLLWLAISHFIYDSHSQSILGHCDYSHLILIHHRHPRPTSSRRELVDDLGPHKGTEFAFDSG